MSIINRVQVNRELTDLGDFPALKTIGEYFSVSAYSLTDLGDFPALKTIGGYFSVFNNRKLTDVGDFPNLTSIGVATLRVYSEIWVIDSVSIAVERNPSLSDCYVLIDFLPGGAHAVSGKIFINNNAVGCNSGDEIMAPSPPYDYVDFTSRRHHHYFVYSYKRAVFYLISQPYKRNVDYRWSYRILTDIYT